MEKQNNNNNNKKSAKIGHRSLTPGVLNYLNGMFWEWSAFSPSELPHLTANEQQQSFYLLWFYYVPHLNLYEKP